MMIYVAALSGNSGKGVALAFSFSSLTPRISSSSSTTITTSATTESSGVSKRLRKYGALFSTTETSGQGSRTAANPSSSSSPVGSTTGKRITNATEKSKPNNNSTPTKQQKKSTNEIEMQQNRKVPRHVGLICDGNGRWATQRNFPRAAGHLEGARRLVDLIRSLIKEHQKQKQQQQQRDQSPDTNGSDNASDNAVGILTLYAFSTENWNRSPSEIAKIFEAIEFAATAIRNMGNLAEVDLRVIGNISDNRIPESLKKVLGQLEERTRQRRNRDKQTHHDYDHDRLQVCLAVNYGGRGDIVAACRSLAQAVQNGSLDASEITEESLQSQLATGGMPPPDLIVRTGGEHRLSNFLLWESAYAELFVSQVLWPDFTWEGEFKHSLDWYSKRKRNFGGREEEQ